MIKLFVWDDVLSDYTAGVVVALAYSVDEARRIVLASLPFGWEHDIVARAIKDEPKVYTDPVARVLFGGG